MHFPARAQDRIQPHCSHLIFHERMTAMAQADRSNPFVPRNPREAGVLIAAAGMLAIGTFQLITVRGDIYFHAGIVAGMLTGMIACAVALLVLRRSEPPQR